MSVYVDSAMIPFRWGKFDSGKLLLSHMIADTHEELMEMAAKLELLERWIQKPGTPHEHFDVCATKRRRAIELGAVKKTQRELVSIIRLKAGLEPLPEVVTVTVCPPAIARGAQLQSETYRIGSRSLSRTAQIKSNSFGSSDMAAKAEIKRKRRKYVKKNVSPRSLRSSEKE
jgi:hypothetical protein